jgi:copper resistance protein B
MKIKTRLYPLSAIAAAMFSIWSLNAGAQQHMHAEQKNSTEVTPQENQTDLDKTAHDAMQKRTEADNSMSMDHSKMDMGGAQGNSGDPPANARDPHAYSGGYNLDSGAYALPGPRELVLADEHTFGAVLFDRLEYSDGISSGVGSAGQYSMQAWYGLDYDRLVVKAEGELVDNSVQESETQLLWGHAISTFWDSQLGVKFDTAEGPSRQWLALGVKGLAPYWFEVDANFYVGSQGRVAFSVEAEYELLITQRLILQPRVAVTAYSKNDIKNGVGKGLSSVTAGLRLRYEFSRKFAPYLGLEWTGQYGNTADLATLEGKPTRQTQVVAGARFWF